MNKKQISQHSSKQMFRHPFFSVKNTPSIFLISPFCKKFHVFVENWQRNNFPKLYCFYTHVTISRQCKVCMKNNFHVKFRLITIAAKDFKSVKYVRFSNCFGLFFQLLEYPIPPSSSQKPTPGDISGTERAIIDPLVSKRREKILSMKIK